MNKMNSIEFEDVIELFEKMYKFHPNMFFKYSETKFLEELDKSKENWENLDFYGKYYEIMRLNALLGDIHTNISLNFEGNKFLSLIMSKCKEGVFITDLNKAVCNKELLYSQVLEINNIPIDEIIEMGKNIIPTENEDALVANVVERLNQINFLKILGVTQKDEVDITLVQNNEVKTVSVLPNKKGLKSNWVKKVKNFAYQENNDYFYIDIDQFKTKDAKDRLLCDKICAKAEQNAIDGKPIIIDVRDNHGGNTNLFLPLCEVLKEYNARGFCLVDNISASASVLIARALKDANFTLVGEPMAQSSTFHASGKTFTTKNGGLTCNVSTRLRYENFYDLPSSSCFVPRDADLYQEAIKPDVLIETSIEDLKNGKDTCMEYCIKEISKMEKTPSQKFEGIELVK